MQAFDYHPLQQRLFSRWQRARLEKDGFDKQLHDRWEPYVTQGVLS